jgi:hypothetical protein
MCHARNASECRRVTTSRPLTEAGTQIGVYLSNTIPGIGPSEAGAWDRRAEAHGIDVVAVTNEGADDQAQPLRSRHASSASRSSATSP